MKLQTLKNLRRLCLLSLAVLGPVIAQPQATPSQTPGQTAQSNQASDEQKTKRAQQAAAWEGYIQGAGKAIISDDLATAEILLNAAMDLAKQMGPRNLRLYITGTMLQANYQDQRNDDAWQKVQGETPQLTKPKFGKEFLPVATLLESVADKRYDAWDEQDLTNDPKAGITIATAAEYERLTTEIRQSAMDPSDRLLASTEGFLGLILTKQKNSLDYAEEVSDLYESAARRYESGERSQKERLQNSQDFSVIGYAEHSTPRESDDILIIRILQAKRYAALGDTYKDRGQEKEAKESYAQSQRLYESVLKTMQEDWKEHPNTAFQEYNLASVLGKESALARADHDDDYARAYRQAAIEHMRVVLRYYEKNKDLYQASLEDSANLLASYLEQDGKKEEAERIRHQYARTSQSNR
jgi:hypothetical protein